MKRGIERIEPFIFASARLEMVFFGNGQVVIENFYARDRGQGHGRACLKLATNYADMNGITLRLKARKYGDEDDTPEDHILVEVYEKHGFVLNASYKGSVPPRMIRKPQGEK